MNYVERHFGDWARDTVHLSMLEDGAYNRLVDLYYVREQPLPAEVAACCRLARAATKADRDAIKSVLQEFFDLTADGWRHKRCDQEIDRFRAKSGKAAASARARWGADRSQSEGNANASVDKPASAMRTHTDGMSNAMPHAGAGGRAPTPQTPNTKHQGTPPAARVPPAPSAPSAAPANPRAKRPAAKPERPEDVTEQVWDDWCALRKAKRTTASATAVAGARAEAVKAGMTLDRFLAVWCTRGSQGLEAAWLTPEERRSGAPPPARNGAARADRAIATAMALAGRSPPPAEHHDPRPEPPLADVVIDVPSRVVG